MIYIYNYSPGNRYRIIGRGEEDCLIVQYRDTFWFDVATVSGTNFQDVLLTANKVMADLEANDLWSSEDL